jgi:hypothetical protein
MQMADRNSDEFREIRELWNVLCSSVRVKELMPEFGPCAAKSKEKLSFKMGL